MRIVENTLLYITVSSQMPIEIHAKYLRRLYTVQGATLYNIPTTTGEHTIYKRILAKFKNSITTEWDVKGNKTPSYCVGTGAHMMYKIILAKLENPNTTEWDQLRILSYLKLLDSYLTQILSDHGACKITPLQANRDCCDSKVFGETGSSRIRTVFSSRLTTEILTSELRLSGVKRNSERLCNREVLQNLDIKSTLSGPSRSNKNFDIR